MRLSVALLACLTASTVSQTLADPPAAAAPTAPPAADASASAPAAAASSPTPATPAATAPADSAEELLEKNLRAEGYRLHMRNGEKVFCRRETPVGSHLPTLLHCMTAEEARTAATEARNNTERVQRNGNACLPGGCGL